MQKKTRNVCNENACEAKMRGVTKMVMKMELSYKDEHAGEPTLLQVTQLLHVGMEYVCHMRILLL